MIFTVLLKGLVKELYTMMPPAMFDVFTCLKEGFPVDLQGGNPGSGTLCHHYGDQTGTGSHIQDASTPGSRCPGSQQYPICAYLHGRTPLSDGKAFELEIIIAQGEASFRQR